MNPLYGKVSYEVVFYADEFLGMRQYTLFIHQKDIDGRKYPDGLVIADYTDTNEPLCDLITVACKRAHFGPKFVQNVTRITVEPDTGEDVEDQEPEAIEVPFEIFHDILIKTVGFKMLKGE